MDPAPLSRFARGFVAVVFVLIAVSFWLSLGSVLYEFRGPELAFILAANSNLFLFFPTLGLVALAAFYVPAVIFTDLYWRGHVKYGRARFCLGAAIVIGFSIWVGEWMNDTWRRAIWEIAPAKLEQDAGREGTCARSPSDGCRPSLMDAAREVREEAVLRLKMSPFVRDCAEDPKLERAETDAVPRYCFPAGRKLDAQRCCAVQGQLRASTYATYSNPAYRSEAAWLDRQIFLPIKAFFVLVIILIGVMLIRWKARLALYYRPLLPAMERGLQIGALAMLPWLLMDYGSQHAADLLYGPAGGFPLRLSLVLIPWALVVVFYFADRIGIELVRLVQLASGIISLIAILNYRDVFDWSAKAFGVGALAVNFVILGLVSFAALVYLLFWIPGALRGEDKGKDGTGLEGGFHDRPQT